VDGYAEPASGPGRRRLPVHGAGDLTKQVVRYRNVRVKRLDAAGK
jgi:hypothetical protein